MQARLVLVGKTTDGSCSRTGILAGTCTQQNLLQLLGFHWWILCMQNQTVLTMNRGCTCSLDWRHGQGRIPSHLLWVTNSHLTTNRAPRWHTLWAYKERKKALRFWGEMAWWKLTPAKKPLYTLYVWILICHLIGLQWDTGCTVKFWWFTWTLLQTINNQRDGKNREASSWFLQGIVLCLVDALHYLQRTTQHRKQIYQK